MTEADTDLVKKLIADAIAPCRDCRRHREEDRIRELIRWRAEIMNSSPADRLSAIRTMTHATRVRLLDGVDADVAIELVAGLDRDDQRMIIDAMPASVRVRCEPYAHELVRYLKLKTAFQMSGHTGSGPDGGRIALTAEQFTQLRDLKLAHYGAIGVSGYRQLVGLYLNEGHWVFSEPQLRALLSMDAELGELIESGKITVTPLSERESRDWMARP